MARGDLDSGAFQALLASAVRREGDLDSVARSTGVSIKELRRLEQGDLTEWTVGMIERLAGLVNIDPAAVWEPGWRPVELQASFLRGQWADFDHSDLAILERAVERGAVVRALREIHGLGHQGVRRRFQARVPSEPYFGDGYDRACEVRRELDSESAPLIDLHRLIPREFAIAVVFAKLKSARMKGAAVFDGRSEAIIVNSQLVSRLEDERRVIAHELSHVLFDVRGEGERGILDAELATETPEEARANAFAAELLVPLPWLEQSLGVPLQEGDPDRAVELTRDVANRCIAPWELVARHLGNHRYIARHVVDGVIGRRPHTSDLIEHSNEDIVDEWINKAFEEGLITQGRANELRKAG